MKTSVKITAFVSLLTIAFIGCTEDDYLLEGYDIHFENIEHYFVKNSYADSLDGLLTFLIINDTATFNFIYHPTCPHEPVNWIGPEDFEYHFLIVIIRQASNNIYRFFPKRVYLLNDTLNIEYRLKLMEKNASYSTRPKLLLLIEKCPYQGIIFYENGEIVKQLK